MVPAGRASNFPAMAPLSPYRSLPADRRLALVTHDIAAHRQSREGYIQRIVSRGGGFRRETLRKWTPAQLAREIVRANLETPQDELGLLQTLYVELEPAIQVAFLEAANVAHDGASIPDDLKPPYTDAATVKSAAEALVNAHGDDGRRYLHTIALYNGDAWPGISDVLADLG